MKSLSKKNKRTIDEDGETNGGNDDQHLVKSNKSVDAEEHKKMKKKKKEVSEEIKSNDGQHFIKSNITEDGEQDKKMKKKKKKLREESKSNDDQHLVKSNRSEDDEQYKKTKKKKKKLSEESKHAYTEFKSNECEDDGEGRKMKKKKKLSEENKHKEYIEFKSNECEDDGQEKKMKKKKKKIIAEGKHEDYTDIISNKGGDDDQGKAMKNNKLSHKSKSNENNHFNSNEGGGNACSSITEVSGQGKKMKKKMETKESHDSAHKDSPNSAGNGTSKRKRVTFSDQLEEVCCDGDQGKAMKKNKLSHKSNSKENNDFNSNEDDANAGSSVTEVNGQGIKKMNNLCCDGLVRGRRYTPEEDEKIKAAVFDYIDSHGLGDEGLDMVLNLMKHREIKGCWNEIAKVLPERPTHSVYVRAHVLFENKGRCKWKPEELEFIKKAYEIHGADWRPVGDALGKSRFQVKDAWRRLKFTKAKKGPWTQEELQKFFDLVNMDLRVRAKEPYRRAKHGMLRDNISWEAIANQLETRTSPYCCKVWYEQLTSPMVMKGEWCDTDDFRLIDALYTLDACCMQEVDWDDLLEHRSGDICRKRWDEMVRHIGGHVGKPFIEQVELLAKRFCPDLLEVREAFDNKPVIC